MNTLSDLYDATRAYELAHGLADEPEFSTPILKKRIRAGEDLKVQCRGVKGNLSHWFTPVAMALNQFTFLRIAPEPTPEEWQVGDVLQSIHTELRVEFMRETGRTSFGGRVTIADQVYKIGNILDYLGKSCFRIHHRPTPEEHAKSERLAANAKLRSEWEKERFPVEIAAPDTEDWLAIEPDWDAMKTMRYRRKPDPTYIPWTAEDAKEFRGIWIRSKRTKGEFQIVGVKSLEVVFGMASFLYESLFIDFEQLDGIPCGKVKEDGK